MYKYTHLIKENIAPIGAQKIGVYDVNGKRVGGIGLDKLSSGLSTDDRLFRFAAISDPHVYDNETYRTSIEDFKRALTYIENSDCAFTCICGDLSNSGVEAELKQYKSIVDTYAKTKPVYAIVGNHENYSWYKNKYDIAEIGRASCRERVCCAV